jgi:hypothetical protein
LLLALASTVILGSRYRGTHDHILLSNNFGRRETTYLMDRRQNALIYGYIVALIVSWTGCVDE